MARATVQSVTKRSNAIHRQYEREYAGQSRNEVLLGPMDKVIERARVVASKAKKLHGKGAAEIYDAARRRLKLYQDERLAIAEAQNRSDVDVESSELGRQADQLAGRYNVHFAGKNRMSRDRTRLAEIVAQCTAIHSRLQDLARTHAATDDGAEATRRAETVAAQLETFKSEAREFDEAWAVLDAESRAGHLAGQANALFAQIQVQMDGIPRTTVRPGLIARLESALITTKAAMETAVATAGVLTEMAEHLPDNIRLVEERLAVLQTERDEVGKAWEATPVEERLGHLATAANTVFEGWTEHFAGQSRETRELERLRGLADRLDEIELQMRAGRPQGSQAHERNLSTVRQMLGTFRSEFRAILDAQKDLSPATTVRPDRAPDEKSTTATAPERAVSTDPLAGLLRVKQDG